MIIKKQWFKTPRIIGVYFSKDLALAHYQSFKALGGFSFHESLVEEVED